MRVRILTPAGFSFRHTVLSHGWCTLPPFEVGDGGRRLAGVVALEGGGSARYTLSESPEGSVYLESPGRPAAPLRRQLVSAARRVLNLDLDLAALYRRLEGDPHIGWISACGAGRLLRAPSTWEDLVKLVLTTNCSWALTTRMCTTLVERWGEPAPGGGRAFPRAEALARAGARELRLHGRTGYRAPLLARLAREVSAGRVELEPWERGEQDAQALRAEMLALPGVGPYVAENLLKMLGRPAGLGLDSWLRAKYARVYHGGRRITDRTIARRYARFGEWAGLVLWCEMTRDWFEGDEPSVAWTTLT